MAAATTATAAAIAQVGVSLRSFGDPEYRRDDRHLGAGIPVLDDHALAHRRPALQAVILAGDDEQAVLDGNNRWSPRDWR